MDTGYFHSHFCVFSNRFMPPTRYTDTLPTMHCCNERRLSPQRYEGSKYTMRTISRRTVKPHLWAVMHLQFLRRATVRVRHPSTLMEDRRLRTQSAQATQPPTHTHTHN